MRKGTIVEMKIGGHIGELLSRCTQILDDDALRVIVESGEQSISSRLSDKGGAAFMAARATIKGERRFILGGCLKDPEGGCSYCVYVIPDDATSDEAFVMIKLLIARIRELNGLEGVPCKARIIDNAEQEQNN